VVFFFKPVLMPNKMPYLDYLIRLAFLLYIVVYLLLHNDDLDKLERSEKIRPLFLD